MYWLDQESSNMVLYSAGRTTSYPEEAPKKGLRYHCLGGGDEVGNVGIVFENDQQTRLLLDYGLAPCLLYTSDAADE